MRNASSDEWKQTGNRTDDDEWRMMAKIEAPNIIRTVIIDSKKRMLIRAENQRSDLLLRQDGVGEKKKYSTSKRSANAHSCAAVPD